MTVIKQYKSSLMILMLHLLAVLYFAFSLESNAMIPTHWNINGEVDAYMGKWQGLIQFYLINLSIFVFFIVFPYISPGYRIKQERYQKILPSLLLVLVLFFALIHVFSLIYALNQAIFASFNPIIILVGILIMFTGNLMPKTPQNFFIGIKTPWTLSSEEIWIKTHRFGGKCLVLAGLILAGTGIIPDKHHYRMIMSAVCLILFILPVIYSLVLYLQKKSIKQNKESL